MRLMVLMGLLLNFAISAQAEEIFGKQDAQALFSLSLNDWKQNLIQAKAAGAADFDTDDNLEYTMIIETPDGRVLVTPSYSQINKLRPWKLSVSVVFEGSYASLLSNINDRDLRLDLVENVYSEMLPHFTVLSTVELYGIDRVIQSAQIFEAGTNLIIDDLAERQKGCFKKCIKRLN